MASSSNKIERSLNRIIPKAPTDRILEETIVKIRLKLCELASPDTEPQETGTTDKHPWNDIPRLYTFLRMLSHNHKDVVALIQKERLNDYSLPIDSTALRQLQADVDQEYFEDTQALFLSDDSHMTIEALGGLHNDHRRLEDGTAFFENIKILGQGSSATVYRVRHRVSRSEFACKRIKRASIKQQYNQLEDFLREMRVLKRVDHLHVVKLIASYTDETTFSLVLLPVANDTLDSLLDRISSSPTFPIIPGREASILRRAFGCLLSTIAYLQAKDIRHKDIKPLNILLGDEGRIYLCDFGISLDYSDTKDGTTEGMPIGFTKGYCAPEVPGMESRNSLSEVWSLGRVFFDIMVVLRGRSVQHAKNYIGLDAERMPDLIAKYLAPLVNESNNAFDTLIMQYIIRMTAYDKGQRPAAAELLQEIPFNGIAEDVRQAYLGECCIVDYHKAGYVDNYKLGSTGPPSSVPSSPPNGFPIVLRDGCTGCLCVAQTQNGKPTEEQILLVTFASVTASSPSRSSCTDDKCTSPERPNNEITVIFRDETTAQIFLRTVTHAISDASLQWQTVGLPHMQELRAIKAQQSPAHFIVHISAWKGNETASTMFILWQDPIFDLHTHCRPPKTERTLMTRFCGRVSTPRYLSNVTNRPSDDKTVVATCSRADLVFSEYKLELSLGQDIDELGLPLGLKEQLTFLTGWTIRFFASGIKVAGPGRLGKSYGYSDVILWEHDRTATLPVGSVLNSVFAFRQTGTKKDYLWRTGTITARSQATYRDPTVEITVFGKSSGDLLDAKDLTTTMEADLQQTGQQSRRRTGKQKEIHQEDGFRLHFDNHNDYRRFFACFDNLRETARADPHMWKFQRNPTVMSHGSQSTASSFRPGPHV
ncbi:hypothetical protein E8E11_010931 [Didymella keratinophila]|nr:hypothetical protein E8E11_010931 [Didymella keratinophila]